jgi:hypothetical protein
LPTLLVEVLRKSCSYNPYGLFSAFAR